MTAAGERLIAAAKEMRTMAKIPEDIIKAGRRCYDGLGRGSVSDSEHIAIALLAAEKRGEERERGRTDKALREYRARLNDIPLGHENAQRGASTYNWKVTVYEEIAAAIRKGSD